MGTLTGVTDTIGKLHLHYNKQSPELSSSRNVSCQMRLREDLSRGAHAQRQVRALVVIIGEIVNLHGAVAHAARIRVILSISAP